MNASALLCGFLLAACPPFCRGEFVLTDAAAGVAPAPIVLAKDAPVQVREAAGQLAAYIEKVSGAKAPIVESDPARLPERAIWIGAQGPVRSLFPQTSFDFQHPEETLVAVNGPHLLIAGRDRMAGEVATESGTVHAIYSFIGKDLGVRWLWPGALGTDIPRSQRIAFAPFERRFHPPFRYRLLWPRNPPEWHRAQHVLDVSFRYEAGHGFTKWWDAYHEAHPDYFALQPNGTRTARTAAEVKLCTSNPKVAEQWLALAEEAFRNDPAKISMSASPNDGPGFCVCKECRALDHPDGPPVFGYVALTDRYVKFWNTLARGLRQRFPQREAWVGAYAYSAYRSPPIAERLEPNIAIGYVGHFPMGSDESRRAEKEQWLGWAKQAKAMIYRPNLFHYSGGFLGLPTLSLRKTIEDFRFLAEHQCIGLEVDTLPMCWATQGVQNYLMAQLAYDPLQDGEALLRDYCERGFGPAAGEVLNYFRHLDAGHDAVLERITHSSGQARQATEFFQEIYTDAFWARAASFFQAADAKLAGAPEIYRQRLDFLRTGFEGARLQVEVLRAMKQLRLTGGKDAAALKHADELCAARDAVFAKYNGQAIKAGKWYVESRKLADYVGPPSEAMRAGTYTEPVKAPSSKAKD
jgi:hypothetical protein